MALKFKKREVEKIVFDLANSHNMRLVEDLAHYSLVTGGMTALGFLFGGRLGAMAGGALGYHLAGAMEDDKLTFQEYWDTLGDKVVLPLLTKIYDRLRTLDISDYAGIVARLAAHRSLKAELVQLIIRFFIDVLGKNVVCQK